MTRKMLEEELGALKAELIKMCRLTEQMIFDAVKSLVENDEELAKSTTMNDDAVDELEMSIEKRCMKILWKEQPMAADFRLVSTTLKVITDIERIGDQAADIAATGLSCTTGVKYNFIAEMGALAVEMVRESVNSFIRDDVVTADAAMKKDDRMDELFVEAKETLIRDIRGAAKGADDAIYVLTIAKYLERIGDHAVNVCEWAKYNRSGVHQKYQ